MTTRTRIGDRKKRVDDLGIVLVELIPGDLALAQTTRLPTRPPAHPQGQSLGFCDAQLWDYLRTWLVGSKVKCEIDSSYHKLPRESRASPILPMQVKLPNLNTMSRHTCSYLHYRVLYL